LTICKRMLKWISILIFEVCFC